MLKTSNNEVEYEALLVGMEICSVLGAEWLKAFSDPQLVAS